MGHGGPSLVNGFSGEIPLRTALVNGFRGSESLTSGTSPLPPRRSASRRDVQPSFSASSFT